MQAFAKSARLRSFCSCRAHTNLVGKEEEQLSGVLPVLEHSHDDLKHRSDPSPSSNKPQLSAMADLFWLPRELNLKVATAKICDFTRWSPHVHSVSKAEGLEVLRHLPASWVLRVHVGKVHLMEKAMFGDLNLMYEAGVTVP